MKALVDTCIIVDFLQAREPFAESARAVLRAAASELCLCCITAISATDIYYLTHRCTHNDKESRSKLEQLLSVAGMLDSAADDVLRAIPSEISDFEDAVMIETAVRSGMDCIITRNTKDYARSVIPVYTPKQFVRLLEQEG